MGSEMCIRDGLYSLGCPGTHFVDQAGLELRNPPVSASQVLGLKACTTTPGSRNSFVESQWTTKSQSLKARGKDSFELLIESISNGKESYLPPNLVSGAEKGP